MAEFKLGKIYTAENLEGAKKYVGKKGFFTDYYAHIIKDEDIDSYCVESTLTNVDCDEILPFFCSYGCYQFFRPILEEDKPERMTFAELLEWGARGNGVCSQDFEGKEGIEDFEDGDEPCWDIGLSYSEEYSDKEIGEDIRIRHFGTKECLIPTREIFLKDCRNKK